MTRWARDSIPVARHSYSSSYIVERHKLLESATASVRAGPLSSARSVRTVVAFTLPRIRVESVLVVGVEQ